MPNWLRIVLAIAAGFIVWFAVATVGNLAIRWLLSGYSEAEALARFGVGVAGFVQKPYSAATLAEKVAEVMTGRRRAQKGVG